jgi:hypothetical protein
MPTEIYDNIKLNKPAPLDARLVPVNTRLDLPAATSSFLFEGAQIYVTTEKAEYRLEKNTSNVFVWVKQSSGGEGLTQGIITILPTTTQIDLTNVSPAIATCDSVVIQISGSATTANIYKIANLPVGQDMRFYVASGKDIVFKHTDLTTASDGALVLEDGRDIQIYGRAVGNEMLWLERNGTALVQRGATQFVGSNEWAQVIIEVGIDDNLLSVNTNRALSANQGKVLNETKQDKFSLSPAERLNYNATTKTLSFLPYETEAIGLNWTTVQITAASSNVSTFLTSLNSAYTVALTSQKNRYIDMTPNAVPNKALNFGIWFIPAGMSLGVAANWMRLSPPEGILQVQFPLALGDISSPSTVEYRSINFSTAGVGNLKNFLTFDTIGGSGSAYSFKFTNTEGADSIYEIEYNIILKNNSTVQTNMFLTLYKNISGTLVAVPNVLPSGSAEMSSDTPYNAWGTGNNRFQVNLRKKVQVSAGVSTSFTAVLKSELPSAYFNNIEIMNGTLTITKIA